jgi:hypothetical protein
VLEVVTDSVVDAPAASVAVVEPEEANATEAISGTEERLIVAVCVDALTFLIVKTFVNVRAEGTTPNDRERESTLPEAIGVLVPA